MARIAKGGEILSFNKIEEFYNDNRKKYNDHKKQVMGELRQFIKEGLPIYFLKPRLKTLESYYLKARRLHITDVNGLTEELTDFSGIRILCLFEDNVIKIDKYFFEKGFKSFKLKERQIYWRELKDKLFQTDCEEWDEVKEKESGYRSVHYLLERDGYDDSVVTEIQLETVLRDTWAELEHNMVYKQGHIHPYISNSFKILADDLAVKDSMLSHLNHIKSGIELCQQGELRNSKPTGYLVYSEADTPKEFETNGKLADWYTKYKGDLEDKVSQYREHYDQRVARELEEGGLSRITKLENKLSKHSKIMVENPLMHYWLNMERAYFMFWKGELKKASRIYRRLLKTYPDKYVPHFRLGEIHFIEDNIFEALKEFDSCEKISEGKLSREDKLNSYNVKKKIALIYWFLGPSHIDLALEKAEEAEKIKGLKKEEIEDAYQDLLYYWLEKYIYLKEKWRGKGLKIEEIEEIQEVKGAFKKAEDNFNKIDKTLNGKKPEYSNICDTLAWFCLHAFQKDPEKYKDYASRSEGFITLGWTLRNVSLIPTLSRRLHYIHYVQIMQEVRKQNNIP